MRGRKPVPTALKIIRGNPGKRALNKHEPEGGRPLKAAPEWLSESQKYIWKKAIKQQKNVLRETDESIFTVWVVAYDTYQRAAQTVARSGLMTRAAATSDNIVQNPLLAIQNRQAELVLRACSQMGFDPTSRTRIHVPETSDEPDPWSRL